MENIKEINNENLESVNGGITSELTRGTYDVYVKCTLCGKEQVIKVFRRAYSPGEHWERIGTCPCGAVIDFKIPRGPAKFTK